MQRVLKQECFMDSIQGGESGETPLLRCSAGKSTPGEL